MDRLNRFHADNHGSVHRRPGLFQNARHLKRLVVMLCKRGDTVRDHDRVADAVIKRSGHIRADHRIKEIRHDGALGHRQSAVAPIPVALEEVGRGAHHPELPVAVAERNGNDPVHVRPRRDVEVAVPGDVVGRAADPENRVEQQLDRPGSGANDQIRARNGIGETGLCACPNLFDPEKQRNRQRNREHCHRHCQQARGERRKGKAKDHAARPPLSPGWTSAMSLSAITRSNRPASRSSWETIKRDTPAV